MSTEKVFGPVPSRRLGRSIGVNNIPPKICSYSCVYCQIGWSLKMTAKPEEYYPPQELADEVKTKIDLVSAAGEEIDYLTVVPDGEPTLDANLGVLLKLLGDTGIKTAVITNSTMLHRPEVRDAICLADWVSVKVDAATEKIWRKVDKPHRSLDFQRHLAGTKEFALQFSNRLVTETMLVRGINDGEEELCRTADFISGLSPELSYISIPTRPPADSTVKPPDETTLAAAWQIYTSTGLTAEHLIGYEGNEFSPTGDPAEDILGNNLGTPDA